LRRGTLTSISLINPIIINSCQTIEYCGTASETSEPTKNTALLDESYRKKKQIRVIRAVKKGSKYAPKEGFRYDGLYEITEKEILDSVKAMSRFSMKRVKGQDPIRFQGPEMRPTGIELTESKKIEKLLA